MTRPALPIPLSFEERLLLEDRLRSRKTPERLRLRCQIILLGASGLANTLIASRLKLTRSTVLEWRRRFTKRRIPGLLEDCADGNAADAKMDRANQIRELLEAPPPEGTSAWTVRALAKAADLSPATIQRFLESANLRINPRRPSLHGDLEWVGGVVDVAGFYLHSPFHTVALEVDLGNVSSPSALLCPAPKPGDSAWLLHLHLRSIEGLRQTEERSTHYLSNFWNFLLGLQPRTPGNIVWCLTDTPLHPDYLKQLEFENRFLRVTRLEAGHEWLNAMKMTIVPALQSHIHQGRCPSIQDSVQALETFIRDGAQDPLQWRSSA